MTHPGKESQKIISRLKLFNLHNHIAECLRSRFYKWPPYNETLDKARVIVGKKNKDGTESRKPYVFYKCRVCQQLFKRLEVEVDHIHPVIDIEKGRENYVTLVERQFTKELQVLCKSCHRLKTNAENKERRRNK